MMLSGAAGWKFCQAPDAKCRAVLLFGSDRGLVAEAGRVLIAQWLGEDADPMRLSRLGEEALAERLFDALQARPLFGGGEPIVHMRLDSERSAQTLVRALEAYESGQLLIAGCWLVEAGDLTKKSRLRQKFSQAKSAQAIELVADEADAVCKLLAKAFDGSDKAEISDEACAICADALSGNRALAVSEIEKIRLYAQGLGRPLSQDDVSALLLAGQDRDAGKAADAALAGDKHTADRAAMRYFQSGGAAVSALRTLYFRLMRLVQAQAGERWLRPPVIADERPDFERARHYWTPARLVRAMDAVREAELNCKQPGPSDIAVAKYLLADIAARRL